VQILQSKFRVGRIASLQLRSRVVSAQAKLLHCLSDISLGVFFLVTVVLSTAVAGRAVHLAPVAIGLTLVFNILMGGALTGAAFNPARALGPMIVTGNLSNAWLYGLAPIVGAIIAAVVHLGLSVLTHERPAAAAAPAE